MADMDAGFHNDISRRKVLRGASATAIGLAGGVLPAGRLEASGKAFTFDPRNWSKTPYRMVQTNLREIDALEDPRRIARMIREFGGNVIVSNIGGIVAFYPTELGLQYVNPYMKGDFVADMIAAARAEGLGYVGRFDLSKGTKLAYDAHPEWFMVNRDGGPREYAGTYQACPNGEWGQNYGVKILEEAISRYDIDGVFFNMTGFPEVDYSDVNHGACVCENCRRAFRTMYNRELPAKDGPADPAWHDYQEFQRRVTEALGKKNYDAIKRARSRVAVFGLVPASDAVRGETNRRVDRPAPDWPHQVGEQARTVQSILPGKPFSATSQEFIDFPWRQVLESGACQVLRNAQALANGAQPDLYLMGSFDGQDDKRFIKPLQDLFLWHAANQDQYLGLETGARTALYFSQRGAGVPSSKYAGQSARGAYSALIDSRIPFAMTNASIGNRFVASDFDVVIMPGMSMLSDEEARALDAYVEGGGLLIATGDTGAYREDGSPRTEMPMRSSPIARFRAPAKARGWTFDAARNGIGLAPVRIAVDGDYYDSEVRDGVQRLLPRAPDQHYGPPEFSYAIPGSHPGPQAGILVRRFGKGWSVHLPWRPDWQYYRDGIADHAAIFAALSAHYAPPPAVCLEGPGAVELTLQYQPGAARALVHVVNYTGQRHTRYVEPPELHGLRLGLRADLKQPQSLVAGRPLSPSAKAGSDSAYRWYDLPPVGAFEAISVRRA